MNTRTTETRRHARAREQCAIDGSGRREQRRGYAVPWLGAGGGRRRRKGCELAAPERTPLFVGQVAGRRRHVAAVRYAGGLEEGGAATGSVQLGSWGLAAPGRPTDRSVRPVCVHESKARVLCSLYDIWATGTYLRFSK
jgi:hypothetical protein